VSAERALPHNREAVAAPVERALPHNLEAERSVLGAVLIHNEAFRCAVEIVASGDFFRDAHRRIFEKIIVLGERNEAIDLVTLKEVLAQAGELDQVGGPAYIASLVDGVPRSTNVEYYARIVKEKSTLRALIHASTHIAQRAWEAEDDPNVILEDAERTIFSIAEDRARADTSTDSRFTTAAESCRDHPATLMVLPPLIFEGAIGSAIGKIKDGKTSLLLAAARCMRRCEGFCGFPAPTRPRRVLYLTEQPQASFTKQLEDAGLQDDDGMLVSYLASWHGVPWSRIAPAAIDYAFRQAAEVMIIDTDARCLVSATPYTAKGGAVILARHGRKSGGSASDAGRGSSAIDGAVDYILHLTKPAGQPSDVRQIECVGRFEMPDRLLIRRRVNFSTSPTIDIGGGEVVFPRYVFEPVTSQTPSIRSQIRSVLSKGAQTVKQISDAIKVSPNTVTRTLQEMAGEVIKVGKAGPKNNAALYGLNSKREGTSPSQIHRDGDVQSFDRDPLGEAA